MVGDEVHGQGKHGGAGEGGKETSTGEQLRGQLALSISPGRPPDLNSRRLQTDQPTGVVPRAFESRVDPEVGESGAADMPLEIDAGASIDSTEGGTQVPTTDHTRLVTDRQVSPTACLDCPHAYMAYIVVCMLGGRGAVVASCCCCLEHDRPVAHDSTRGIFDRPSDPGAPSQPTAVCETDAAGAVEGIDAGASSTLGSASMRVLVGDTTSIDADHQVRFASGPYNPHMGCRGRDDGWRLDASRTTCTRGVRGWP